jgi:ferritin-like protein
LRNTAIENLLSGERGRREVLERALEELKRHAAALPARIQELEQRLRG